MQEPIFTTIYLATDHAGFELKQFVKGFLQTIAAYDVVDCGAHTYVEGDDYPVYIQEAAQKVSEAHAQGKTSVGAIIFGGSGEGEAMAAGRFPHVRTTVCYGGKEALHIVRLGREHNDANILSLAGRFVSNEEVIPLVREWLNTPFSKDERHIRRIAEIEKTDI